MMKKIKKEWEQMNDEQKYKMFMGTMVCNWCYIIFILLSIILGSLGVLD
jgi:hypothetical protein